MKNSRGEIIGKHLDERCQNDFLCNIPEQIKKTKKEKKILKILNS